LSIPYPKDIVILLSPTLFMTLDRLETLMFIGGFWIYTTAPLASAQIDGDLNLNLNLDGEVRKETEIALTDGIGVCRRDALRCSMI